MTPSTKLHTQASAAFKKAQRKEEGIAAWSDHQVSSQAVREKTARLHALRLAKEAADKAAEVDIGKRAPRRRAG
jgi:hypothetical protein